MLADSGTEMPEATKGSANDVCSRKASAAASEESQSRASTTNWSPPSRPTASPGRTCSTSRPADLAQQRVAELVAERVVDRLEPVEVEHQQRGPLPSLAVGERGADQLAAAPPRFGRPVSSSWRGLPGQRLLAAHPLGDVGVA